MRGTLKMNILFLAAELGAIPFAGAAQTDQTIIDAGRCISPAFPLGMEATCLHSVFVAACSADSWPGHCKTLAEFDQESRDLLSLTQHNGLAEDDAKRQLAEMITPRANSQEGNLSTNESHTPPADWKKSIDILRVGGWEYLGAAADEDSMLFASSHHIEQRGMVVSVWFRTEYHLQQRSSFGATYLSYVSREEFDCSRQVMRNSASTTYSANNLSGTSSSEVFEGKSNSWVPAVPGTMGEFMTQWACSKMRAHRQGVGAPDSR